MPTIGQKFYQLLLNGATANGPGGEILGVHDGQVNLKIWGITADSADYVADGSFALDDAEWPTLGTGVTIAGEVAAWDGTQVADSDLTQTPAVALVDGEVYELTFEVLNYSAGNVCGVVGDVEGTDRAANGVFIQEITAGAGADIDIRGDLDFVGEVTGISMVRKSIGWDGATVTIQVLAEDGVTWLDAASKTADFIGTIDLGSSPNETVRAVLSSAGNQTKVSCTASR